MRDLTPRQQEILSLIRKHIADTASLIAARKGMRVRQIGTEKSLPSKIKVGVDDHVNWAIGRYDMEMERINAELDTAIKDKMAYDEESNHLHVEVANQTFAQEKITKHIDFIEKKMGEVKDDKNARLKFTEELRELEKNLDQADQRIKSIFETQDTFLRIIEIIDETIKEKNSRLSELKTEKEAIKTCLTKDDAVPVLKIGKRIYSGTQLEGALASLIVERDLGMGKFIEITTNDPVNPKQLIFQAM